MPIYEYLCLWCERRFEELVRGHGEDVVCPHCGSPRLSRLPSTFAAAARTEEQPTGQWGTACCGGNCGCTRL